MAIALFLAGCWEVANSDLNQLIFRNLSIVNDMAFLMIMLLPIPFMIYVDRIQHKRYHKMYLTLEIICIADYIACTALHNMHIVDYTNTIGFMAIICVTSIFFLVATIIMDIIRHYVKQYRYVAIGMLCVSASAVLQFISYFQTTNIFYGATLAFGLVVLFIFAVGETLDTVGRTYREKQEAIMAGEAKTKFLANVSHEIRTPINTVIGLNTMILRECENTAIRDYAMDIQNASQSLLVLVNDILDLSKIEFGKMELVEAEYDFGGMIRDVINMLTPKARAKKLAFTLSVDEGIPSVLFGDDIRLRQILVNLLNNAVKYTENGSVSLVVKGKVIGEDVQLSFHVKDTGIGIQKEDLQKLCEEFIRINDYRVRNVEGTGLGLSITSQLLELMNSKLQVNSVYGKGSDFYFVIKQHIVNSEALGNLEKRIRIRTEKEGYQASFVAPTVKILLVDDNSMNRKVFLSLLKQTKVQITEAVGGYDCLEKIKTQKYDLIFLDHMMPDVDGVETLHRIKEMTNHPNTHTPVVALTANVNAKSKEYYQAEGFQAFLPKPINPDNLEKMIVSMLPDEMMEQGLHEVVISDDTKELLPAIQGIRWDMALELLQNHNVLVATVADFTLQGRKDKQRLNDYYDSLFAAEDMDEEEAIRLYRIQVHSMKTSAAMIGAIALSELAKYLESAAKG
ncbi:MAG: ATP-binding protein [Eubacteriales bacterium]|nr:ATP-binding protein [Eubacteriales bacterium]